MDYVTDVNELTYMIVHDTFKKRDGLLTLTISEAEKMYKEGNLIRRTVEMDGEPIFIDLPKND